MKIYLLRHGRTLWNEAGRLQGRTDIPLSEDGRAAARAAGRALSDIAFDAAFSSPLRRARETAELILAGRGVAVQTDARLVELSFGAAEGMALEALPPEQRPTWRLFSDPASYVPPDGGESYASLTARCRAFLDEALLPQEKNWENVLVVAHGGVVRGLFSAMFGAASGEIYGSRVQKNCAVNVIECRGGVFAALHVARDYCATV